MNHTEKPDLTPRQREILFDIMTSEERVFCIGRRVGLRTLRELLRFEPRRDQKAPTS